MKIVISRKGFDSSAGGAPSPVFPDGKQLSLPIPAQESPSRVQYRDLQFEGIDLGHVVANLTSNRVLGRHQCHLDPDLDRDLRPRHNGWQPAFGQVSTALKHLQNHDVGVGDLFLFYGWFREVEKGINGRWRFVRNAPHLHRLFGWLQVGTVLNIQGQTARTRQAYPGLAEHPHLLDGWKGDNVLYVAAKQLVLNGANTGLPGAGVFKQAVDTLVLTDRTQAKRSVWRLPGWMLPRDGQPILSYHHDPGRWSRAGSDVILRTVARGQEFVLDTAEMGQAIPWLRNLFRAGC